MHALMPTRTVLLCVLCFFVACGSGSTGVSSATRKEKTNFRSSHHGARCKNNSECPSGQRCGFTGADERGICVVPTATALVDPGGRCGCDGQPVDLFGGDGSTTPFASAPVCFVGPCPIDCSEDRECPVRLVCKSGRCRQPQDPEKK